ncbi:beta-carotene hydroxylase [Aureimonas fodinaquatilis]|uniref:Beta-carotene hydroxylase n=1 Tax=Aureimonas fodinaquatilis TaxID=2565783 RepID=A0A5B0E3I2_9HYPH|nr:sterol desaturase family protein [Aureimonas fodinaquatilis]KAA0971959.1 beta-carotene hydroxylase [Aureimonas fodinaquatilis]
METVLSYLVPILLIVGSVVFMEWFATWSHKHIMHGWGWGWHKSHHEPHDDALEKNDLYALVFAGVAILLFLAGEWWRPLTWIGLGVTIYGFLYFVLHDGLVHQRWPFKYIPRKGYLKRVYQAHRMHHAVKGKEGCVSFGFVYAQPVDKLVKQLQTNRKTIDETVLDNEDERPVLH